MKQHPMDIFLHPGCCVGCFRGDAPNQGRALRGRNQNFSGLIPDCDPKQITEAIFDDCSTAIFNKQSQIHHVRDESPILLGDKRRGFVAVLSIIQLHPDDRPNPELMNCTPHGGHHKAGRLPKANQFNSVGTRSPIGLVIPLARGKPRGCNSIRSQIRSGHYWGTGRISY
jgi:hypothetical protein